ncbi:MAG: glycosyltransferase family A protein [Verrucomicrobiota bacterium]
MLKLGICARWTEGQTMALMAAPEIEFYFRRFGWGGPQIAARPAADLGLTVVIPCFNEPDLLPSLVSLAACARPDQSVEVIVVINASEDAGAEIRQQNQQTLRIASDWAKARQDPKFQFHILDCGDLPRRHAGVGLARKIGMDEALRRFAAVDRSGVIACFDADCLCDPNYLACLESHFRWHPSTPGCSIYFEHPLEGTAASALDSAIIAYELHLRYYVQAARFALFPYAHHTVGSAMAVRSTVYCAQGGMNKRQAGEDFYFLQKVISLGHFTDLTSTRVIPAARPSNRVPFGTGRAVNASLAGASGATYPLECFLDLKQLFGAVEFLARGTPATTAELKNRLSPALRAFLNLQQFDAGVAEWRRHTASPEAFCRRFFGWFNAFRVMKFCHFARDNFYGSRPVQSEARKFIQLLGHEDKSSGDGTRSDLLSRFRALDRGGAAQRFFPGL